MDKITFSNDINGIAQEDIQEAVKLGESYFHTEEDPTQLRNNKANFLWIHEHFPKCLNIIKSREKVIGFTLILLCNKEYMNDFLSKKISWEDKNNHLHAILLIIYQNKDSKFFFF